MFGAIGTLPEVLGPEDLPKLNEGLRYLFKEPARHRRRSVAAVILDGAYLSLVCGASFRQLVSCNRFRPFSCAKEGRISSAKFVILVGRSYMNIGFLRGANGDLSRYFVNTAIAFCVISIARICKLAGWSPGLAVPRRGRVYLTVKVDLAKIIYALVLAYYLLLS